MSIFGGVVRDEVFEMASSQSRSTARPWHERNSGVRSSPERPVSGRYARRAREGSNGVEGRPNAG